LSTFGISQDPTKKAAKTSWPISKPEAAPLPATKRSKFIANTDSCFQPIEPYSTRQLRCVKQYSGLYAMPAKSAAYEKGIREGRAMAARSRNPEASEPEEEEEEEEEMDMAASHSRKRSAKGAKHTKPAKDGGMYGQKRSDALTPIEYLDACELGIQDRSPTYIRARLDAAERLDLKCGKGSISEGEKCTKGAAQRVQPQQRGGSKVRGLKTAAKIAGAAALIGGAAYMQQTARRNMLERGATSGPGTRSNTAFLNDLRKIGGTNETARRIRQRAKQVQYLRSNAKGRARVAAIRNAPMPQPRMKNGRVADPWNGDSIYAEGFSPSSTTFDI